MDANFSIRSGRGPFTTLWTATDYEDPEPAEEHTAGPEECLQEET